MKYSSNPPVYSQVAFDIASKIAAGELKEGERFTGRSLMSSQYGVSSETIRRAMSLLEDMGIVSTQVNVGSTVMSQQRAIDYIAQYKEAKNLLALKADLREKIARRNALNEEIESIVSRIIDYGERFRHSDRLRTFEFEVQKNSRAEGRSIGDMRFRQVTGATIVAVRRQGEILMSPDPQTVIAEGDLLVVACETENTKYVAELTESVRS